MFIHRLLTPTSYYNGIETTDKIVYNHSISQYAINRNVIEESQLSEIDFELINHNRTVFTNSLRLNQYNWSNEYITIIEGRATVVFLGSRVVDGVLTYDCFDYSTNENVIDRVNLADILLLVTS